VQYFLICYVYLAYFFFTLFSLRYFLIQKAKEANTVGIIAGTLGVADYQTAITQLKQMCQRAGKKVYLFVMGKLNVAKLANFAEIDIYTLVACPENSMVSGGKKYERSLKKH
jgi:diphthamide biosynthesis protein 2